MRSYTLSETASKLKGSYLESSEMFSAIKDLKQNELYGLVQLWLTEGIPFLFQNNPFVYENMRILLAQRISINPKQITLIGSARTGYSMDPNVFGRSINNNSDLDFTIVSEIIFQNCKTEFFNWQIEFYEKKILPKNEKTNSYWIENARQVPLNIARGFIDTHKVPNYEQYPIISRLNNSKWRLLETTKKMLSEFDITKISFRVYKDWDHFINQMVLNLNYSKGKML